MKNILLSIFFILACNLANADVKFVSNIEDKIKINWGALNDAVSVLSTEDIRANMLVFFIEHEKDEFSAKDILSYCVSIDDKVTCANFVKTYMDYVGGNANDCAEASSLVGRRTETLSGAHAYYFETFSEALNYCDVTGYGNGWQDDNNGLGTRGNYATNSIYGVCERFLTNVRKCTIHLEAYYEQELLSNKLSKKTERQYRCILNLIKTGQLNLPVSLMEESCK